MQLDFTIELWKKGRWYVARSSELDFISQGKTREEARKNLEEVIKIQFEEMTEMGTLEEYLKEVQKAKGVPYRKTIIVA